jgi:hypothetical protein
MERVDGKAAGDHGFITCQRIGLADGARADAIPNAAGGEGGHGAAKPDGVIHRYVFNLKRPALTWVTGETSLIELTRFNPLLRVPGQVLLLASYYYSLLFATDLVGCLMRKESAVQ